jgi:hypothetical protein
MVRLIAIGTLAWLTTGCSVIGPSCVSRQERGTVTSITGQVAAGQIAMHRVPYEAQGSQNDARVDWPDARSADGPRLRFYATRVECTDFQLPANSNIGDCATLASAGRGDMGLANTLIVTHGRGNPERLGNPPEYKIWVAGDPERLTGYTIEITWFFGPDC